MGSSSKDTYKTHPAESSLFSLTMPCKLQPHLCVESNFSHRCGSNPYQVFSDRYEKASLLVTSNLAFGEWTRVFGEASLTAALLDRFTHRCYIYEFDWESIRLAESLKRQKKIRRKRAGKSRPK